MYKIIDLGYFLKINNIEISNKLGDFELIGAATINSKTYALWKNPKTKEISQWEMDANWNYVNGETFAGDDDKAIQIESEYNFDLNGDGSIGFDSSKNGKFDDADLSAGSLEQHGDFKSLKEMGGLMKIIKEKYTGKIDMGLVGKIAKSLLGN